MSAGTWGLIAYLAVGVWVVAAVWLDMAAHDDARGVTVGSLMLMLPIQVVLWPFLLILWAMA